MQETFLCNVVTEFLARQVSEPLLYRNDLMFRAILQTLSLWDKTSYDAIHVLDHPFVTRTIWMRVVDAKITRVCERNSVKTSDSKE